MIQRLFTHHTLTRYVILFVASIYLIIVGFDTKYDDGIVGRTRKNGVGCTCHDVNANANVHVWVSGPATVNAGSIHTYTLSMVGGPAVAGGFNVASRVGALSSTAVDVQTVSGELTHVSPKLFAGDTVRWTFRYTAPLGPTQDTIYSAGNSVNHNLIPDNGDQWNFGNDFIVTVNPAPPSIPALSLVGFCLLGILLVLITLSRLRSRRIPENA